MTNNIRRSLCMIALLSASVQIVGAAPLTPNVTRAESAMILLQTRMGTVPDVRDAERFPDVIPGAWYERYVVLGERYGLLDADPVTKAIRPDHPVSRIAFLRMMTYAFGLPENLPYRYRDIALGSENAKYAGIATAYGLFPETTQSGNFNPTSELTHAEAARAVWMLDQALYAKKNSVAEQQAVAQSQAKYGLTIYDKTSSKQDRVTVSKLVPLHSAPKPPVSTPRLEAPVLPVIVRAGDDAALLPRLRSQVLDLVNAERQKAGLGKLRVSPTLEASAQLYAADMASRGFFGHVTPEGSTLRDRMTSSGYYRSVAGCADCVDRYELGENLALGQLTPAEAVRDWLRSPSHRAALLSPSFTETGIGISAGIWVEHFGGRK